MTTKSIHLQGTLTAASPIVITRPEAKMTVPRMKAVLEDGSTVLVPFIPGETFKGMLRNLTAEQVREAIIAHPDFRTAFGGRRSPWTLEDFYFNAIGGVKGAEKQDLADLVNQEELRARNPIISLFGSATPWIAGKLIVQHAIPEQVGGSTASAAINLPGEAGQGVRRDPFIRNPNLFETLETEDVEAWADMTAVARQVSALRTQLKTAGLQLSKLRRTDRPANDPEVKALEKQIADLEKEEEKLKKDEGYKNAVSMPYGFAASIAIGSRFTHGFTLNRATPTELGLLLAGLTRVGLAPRIGGHESTGYGYFKAEYSVFEGAGEDRTPIGSVSIDRETGTVIKADGAFMKQALDAWKEASATIISDRFDFAASSEKAAGSDGEGRGKKAGAKVNRKEAV